MARSGIVPPTLRLRTFITGPVVTPDFAAEGDTARADIPPHPPWCVSHVGGFEVLVAGESGHEGHTKQALRTRFSSRDRLKPPDFAAEGRIRGEGRPPL